MIVQVEGAEGIDAARPDRDIQGMLSLAERSEIRFRGGEGQVRDPFSIQLRGDAGRGKQPQAQPQSLSSPDMIPIGERNKPA